VPGVDAAEQRLDEPVDERSAETGREVGADRDVVLGRAAGEVRLEPHPGDRGRTEHARRPQRPRVGRHAEQGARRQGVQPTPDEHAGRRGDRVHQ
jgi:hypothetical protein